MSERWKIRQERRTAQINRDRPCEVRGTFWQIRYHSLDEGSSIIQLKCPVGLRLLADGREWRRRNLPPTQRSRTVRGINFYLRREPEQFTEKRIVQHSGEFVRTDFQVAQVRSSDVTGKKCIARKQNHRSARLEQTQTNAVGRMTRRRDHLDLNTPQGDSITIFEVAVGKGGRCRLRNQNGSTGSGRELGMASHEICVRMGQKNVPQFEPILSEIIKVPLYIPFWIDYKSLASRCDDVRSVRESRNKKSLNMHWTSVRTVGIPLWALRATPPPALRVAGLFLFDWHTHHIPPLGPGSVVVPNIFEPEQFGQYKPSVTGALADSAVNDRVAVRLIAKIILINLFEFLTVFESAVVIGRRFPRDALRPRVQGLRSPRMRCHKIEA